MNEQKQWLNTGQALTCFTVSESHAVRFAEFSPREPQTWPMDYHFSNGGGPLEESSIRRFFLQTQASRLVHPTEAMPTQEVYFSADSDTVSFSSFRHVAFHEQRWLRTELVVPYTGDYQFRLATCGGVRIWCDGQLAACFTPFSRNRLQEQEISLPLRAGKNQILIHLDELFERDALFVMQMIYLSEPTLGVALSGIDMHLVKMLSAFASSLRPQLAVRNHQVCIACQPLASPEMLYLSGELHGMGNDNFTPRLCDFGVANITPNGLLLTLPEDVGEAHYQLILTMRLDDVVLRHHFGINVLPDNDEILDDSLDLVERKHNALRYTAMHGMDRTCRLLAMMHSGLYEPQAEALLLSTLERIDSREDCSDFSLVPLLWIWADHHGEYFSAAQWQRIRSVILGYRYWYDEPGNDVMWYWSENHTLCFHVAQYLAGQYFPDEMFTASGRNGREQKLLADKRLMRWFAAIEEYGFVEWNSAPYFPVDYIGLFALYQLAQDTQWRLRAQRLIDQLMRWSALHYVGGIAAGTMGRVYEKELLAANLTELSAWGAVAWGGGSVNRKCASLPMFCASDYQPPQDTFDIARLTRGKLSAWYECGGGKIVVWKQPAVALSSCIDHHSGKPGHQQHLVDIQFVANHTAKMWVNHPGDAVPGSEKRPSFWAGNGIMPRVMQAHHRVLMLWNIPEENPFGWTHLYLDQNAFDQLVILPQGCAVRSGHGFAAVLCSAPLTAITSGQTAGCEWRAEGRKVAWFLTVGEGDEAGFSAFCQQMAEQRLILTDLGGEVVAGNNETMSLTWMGECYVDGQATIFPILKKNELRTLLSDKE